MNFKTDFLSASISIAIVWGAFTLLFGAPAEKAGTDAAHFQRQRPQTMIATSAEVEADDSVLTTEVDDEPLVANHANDLKTQTEL